MDFPFIAGETAVFEQQIVDSSRVDHSECQTQVTKPTTRPKYLESPHFNTQKLLGSVIK